MSNGDMPANPVKGCDGRFIDDNEINNSWMENCNPSIGLTKREAFAMAAMQGLCSNQYFIANHDGAYEEIALNAKLMADTLLKELSK